MTRKADVHYRLVVVSPFGQVLRSGLLLVLSWFSPVPVSMEMGSFCFQQSGTPDSQDPRLTFLYIFLEFLLLKMNALVYAKRCGGSRRKKDLRKKDDICLVVTICETLQRFAGCSDYYASQ